MVENAKTEAILYVERHLNEIHDPFQAALVTYALDIADSSSRQQAYNKLMTMKRSGVYRIAFTRNADLRIGFIELLCYCRVTAPVLLLYYILQSDTCISLISPYHRIHPALWTLDLICTLVRSMVWRAKLLRPHLMLSWFFLGKEQLPNWKMLLALCCGCNL